MKKLIIINSLKSCGDCIYCQHDSDYGISYDSGYDCMNEDATKTRIMDDGEGKSFTDIPFPEWCPLDDI